MARALRWWRSGFLGRRAAVSCGAPGWAGSAWGGWCDAAGTVGGRAFKIEHYAKLPVAFDQCKRGAPGSEERRCTLRFALPD